MKMHYRTIELVVAASVVVISLASLFVAVFQGIVMDRTMKASVMPVIQVGHGNVGEDRESWVMTITVHNTGLGPADIRYFGMRWQGEPIRDTSQFLARCCAPDSVPEDQRLGYMHQAFRDGEMALVFDEVQSRFLAPQERVDFIAFDRPDAETQPRGHAVWQALDLVRHDLRFDVCYCSVFEDCWLARFPAQPREPVARCDIADWSAEPGPNEAG
ncbi:MAG: hypothetical protein CMH93_07555 [Oceanicaulis sp.]|nr:hypothetical protein [Oceanicaulis sp.]